MSLARKGALTLGVAFCFLVLVGVAFQDSIRGAAFVIQASGMQGVARTLADWDRTAFTEQVIRIPWRNGYLSGRRYLPSHVTGRVILLIPGVHASGIDEPRLVGFARDIASSGHPVVTAALDEYIRRRKQLEILDAFGKFDFDPAYDYKTERKKRR